MASVQPQRPLCDLDDTWQDVLAEFRGAIATEPTWSCFFLDNMDRELILSAPEIMDPKTDSGFGYQDICSLDYTLRTGAIPPADTLNEERVLLDLMDHIHAREMTYLKGYSLVQSYLGFPYFFRLDLLKEGCPVLFTYCRGVLGTLDCILRTVFATAIRSDEEFMAPSPELDRQTEAGIGPIVEEIEELAASPGISPAISARLRWRATFLAALNGFLEAKQRADVEEACGLCLEAANLLDSEVYQRKEEPVVDPRLQREKEASFWVSVMAPTKLLPSSSFSEAMAAYKTMLLQLSSLKTLLELSSLNAIVDFVESFGAEQPILPVRCVAVVVLFSNDANESFLYGPSIQQRVLQQLAKDYGSPLYLRIAEGDEVLLEGVLRYRIHKTMDPVRVSQGQLLQLRQQTLDILQHWLAEAGKCFLVHLETMLCNRGLAYQRLLGALRGLAKFQELSYSTDISFFLVNLPGVGPSANAEAVSLSTVLTLFANSYVLRTMELILQFQFELDLLSSGEIIPALWYLNFIQRAQIENFGLLCLPNTAKIPGQRIHKKTRVPLYNLALTTRTVGAPDVVRANLLGASRMLSDAVFLSSCLMEGKGLIDLTCGPPHGMSSVEDIFNHRMLECLGRIHTPPLTSYKRCTSSKLELTREDLAHKIPLYAKKASEVAEGACAKVKGVLNLHVGNGVEKGRLAALRRTLEAFERAASHTATTLKTFSTICEDAEKMKEYIAVVERPSLPYLLNIGLQRSHNSNKIIE